MGITDQKKPLTAQETLAVRKVSESRLDLRHRRFFRGSWGIDRGPPPDFTRFLAVLFVFPQDRFYLASSSSMLLLQDCLGWPLLLGTFEDSIVLWLPERMPIPLPFSSLDVSSIRLCHVLSHRSSSEVTSGHRIFRIFSGNTC